MRKPSRWPGALVTLAIAVVIALAPSAAPAQQDADALKAELEKLRTEMEGLRHEVQGLREFLQQRLAPPTPQRVVADVAVAGSPMLGRGDAAVTIIEFSDYQCPYCARFVDATLPALKKEYIDTGKVRLVFRDFPIDSLHPNARKAAEAAHCAGEQGTYWPMHDTLFRNQEALGADHLQGYARQMGLDMTAFERCMTSSTHASRIQKNLDDGMVAGIRGTPAFFIGATHGDDPVHGVAIIGAQPITEFRKELDRALAEAARK